MDLTYPEATMKLKKIGLIFEPDPKFSWMASHCQLPTPLLLDDNGLCRIFFAARSTSQISSIGYCDLNLNEPNKILEYGQIPVLTPGPFGHYDQYGVFPSSLIKKDNQYYLYFIGWIKGETSPLFYASIGLALSVDGKEFKKYQTVPIMSTSIYDPCLVTSPFVYSNGDLLHMAYVSGEKWSSKNSVIQSHYNIKLATSRDGINWTREGIKLIDFSSENETNIARPSILFINNIYHMWFSYVKEKAGYRIGYAQSNDGIKWVRMDEKVQFTNSSVSSTDNEAQCYPSVIRYKDKIFMFYNGNGFGKFGIELAEIEDLL
jgi:predicted GH43/DUF377 family glycosyl hydrolase